MLALLLGVLLPSDNVVHAADPTWDSSTNNRRKCLKTRPRASTSAPPSRPPTTDEDDDIEFGNTLTYSLGGTDADKFDIDPSTGQLITKARWTSRIRVAEPVTAATTR